MNLDHYIKKKHIFKNRSFSKLSVKNFKFTNYRHLYTVRKFRLEFVFIRLFKRLFRRRFIKAKMRFFKPKYWLLFLPNYILTQKSKNARMGAGVGKFIRLTSIVYPGKSIIKTWHYSYRFLLAVSAYMMYKIPNKFLIKIVTNKKKSANYLSKLQLNVFIPKKFLQKWIFL